MSDDEREREAARLPWPSLLPWQRQAAKDLIVQRASWPHALLIHGAPGIGKTALALHLAQALLCEALPEEGESAHTPCGVCAGCRYAIAGQHPDLMRIERVVIDPDTGLLETVDTIAIDRVRALIDFVQLTSHRQRAKVAVIAPAERMNVAAANALLKTLEEPPPDSYLILVSAHPGQLMPTIVSRCRLVAAPQPSPAQARAWLDDHGVAQAELVLAQAAGSPLAALAHADPGIQAERRAWVAALSTPDRLAIDSLAARIDAGGKDERKPRLALAIDWMIAWCADLARVVAGDAARQNPDAADALRKLAPRVAPIALFRYHRLLLRQRALIAHPLQPRLVAEALLLDYRALFPALS